MYYTNISNNELQYFHNLKVDNFTISLTDMLTSDLFKVETVKENSIYKVYPLFYVNEITCSNANDKVLDNKAIICQKLTSETYFSFISNPEEPIYDYVDYGSYFDVGDDLTENEFNGIVSMLRRFIKHNDNIKLRQGKVKGDYGDYIFNINGTTVTDKGILITEETISNLGTVRLENNVFDNSEYVLHLKVYHMTDINVSGEISSDNIVYEDLEVALKPFRDITIPFSQLDFDYVVGFNAEVVISHNVPIITLWEDVNKSQTTSTGYNLGRGTLSTDGNDRVFTRSSSGSSYIVPTTSSGFANRVFSNVETSFKIEIKNDVSFRFNIEKEFGGTVVSTNYFNKKGEYEVIVTSTNYYVAYNGELVQKSSNSSFGNVGFRVQLDSPTETLKFNNVFIKKL